ncbi:tripartite tricarboxylate transporter substrate binding protein [Cupriavidus sp. UYPR2.512]|uniref:tripartite tricarboxylate transporter substrate binding protein n=1 Tax=Cupriavidus sp. UYPR2.512 TaxID=1080187 RepID=UPI00036762D2|nr:tripartite tricarboxylate transporter substrate binding protein [Cupriavidus sp. UYPR2.512]UIF84922.1 tripartite tricarboxylate transporter substrate binding protein [Cupriavidus necator]
MKTTLHSIAPGFSRLAAALAATALFLALAPAGVRAQSYPSKPITVVVPASPGGAIDLVARLVGQKLTAAWGQSVVVDNRSGATGIVGTDLVAKAAPDGYTLALVASSHAINPSMVRKLPFDTVKSFEPVVLTHVVPLMLVVSPSVPVKSVKELIAYGKAHPGELSFASSGSGGAPHFSGELFKSMAGIDMVHVPYKGSTLAHPDLTSGRVSLMFDTVAAIGPQVKAGKVRALAVTTTRHAAIAPQVPTMAEAGLQGYDTSTWGGFLAPAGTPRAVIDKLNAGINQALAAPDVRERLLAAGIEPAGGSPAQFAGFIQSEMVKWAKVARNAGIQPE